MKHSKQQKIQKMLEGSTSIQIDGIELSGWIMNDLSGEGNDIIFSGYAYTDAGDYHWKIPAWGFGEIAEVIGNKIICKDSTGEECSIECFKKIPYTGK